jgi:acetyltransferase-like isoleucine patch superfamily enzyme
MINGKIDFIFGSILKEIPETYIADNCNIGHNVTFAISGKLEIGFHCLIASNITFQDCSGHSIDPDERGKGKPPQPKDVRPIKIGSNVWIGDGVTILPGAIIGDNCVIAANTIVNRNVPDGVLVYTAPAQMVKIRKIAKMI